MPNVMCQVTSYKVLYNLAIITMLVRYRNLHSLGFHMWRPCEYREDMNGVFHHNLLFGNCPYMYFVLLPN